MQALRDSNVIVNVKDLEWQRSITGQRSISPLHVNPILAAPTPIPAISPNNFTYTPKHTPAPDSPPTTPPPYRANSPVTSIPSSVGGSASSAAPDLDAGERRKGDGWRKLPQSPSANSTNSVAKGRVGKIRRRRLTKEEEARFDVVDLRDLKGSTAAKSRKMTVEERDIMLHKRRLRNRQSAARSRDRQRKTIMDVGNELDELAKLASTLLTRCEKLEKHAHELRKENDHLRKENGDLKKVTNSQPSNSSAFLRLNMSSDMLDKIISGDTNSNLTNQRFPGRLHLSLSTDKLNSGEPMPLTSLPPMPRSSSILERLLDIAATSNEGLNDAHKFNFMPTAITPEQTANF